MEATRARKWQDLLCCIFAPFGHFQRPACDHDQDIGLCQDFEDIADSEITEGNAQITDSVNLYWRVDDNDFASKTRVQAKTSPTQWRFWNWDCDKYVFGKTITYYICAKDTELKLTIDGDIPAASTTDKRVFERVDGENGIYTFKLLNSELYAGLKNKKLELVEKEAATHWEIEPM